MKPPAPRRTLSSEALEHDAGRAHRPGERSDKGSDPHLPASESEDLADESRPRPPIERGLTRLPPD